MGRVLLLLVIFALGGCAQPELSGFLEPYQGFEQVEGLSRDLEYIRPQAPWHTYHSVRIAQVVTYVETVGGYRAVNHHDLRHMTDIFEAALVKAFGRRLEVTTEPGPGVLDVRTAITRLRPTARAANVAAWIVPGSFAAQAVYTAATNTNLALGEAGIEAEFVNSVTGVREYGFVGLNMGSAIDVQQITRWGIAEQALKKWANLLAKRLADLSAD